MAAGSLNSSPARSIGEPASSFLFYDQQQQQHRYLPVEIEGMVDYTIVSGWLKFRDQKKWKLRWGVVTKLSPAADCVHLQLYRDNKDRYKQGLTKASLSLNHFLGVETGFTLDKESNTIAVICKDVVVILAFDTREILIQWQMKINNNLGEGQQFLVQVASSPPKAKINPGPARLHIQNHKLCLTMGIPPSLVGYWELKHLRRYGVLSGKFCFEGGSLCGKIEGLYVLLTDEAEEIRWHIHMAADGRLHTGRHIVSRNKSGSQMTPNLQRKSSDFRNLMDCSDVLADSENVSYAMNRSFENIMRWQQQEKVQNHFHKNNGNLFRSECSTDTDTQLQGTSVGRTYQQSVVKEMPHFKSVVLEENVPKERKLVRHFSDSFQRKHGKDTIPHVHKSLKHPAQHLEEPTKLLNSATLTPDKEQFPARPPKPLKYSLSMPEKRPDSVECTCRHPPHQPHDQYDNYDIPVSRISSENSTNKFKEIIDFEKPEDVLDYYKSAKYYNYDIPPAPVPVSESCSVEPKMSVIVETQNYPSHNQTCACNQFRSCWPYTWLRLASCKKEPISYRSIVTCTADNNCRNNLKQAPPPLYATVDLSKKKQSKNNYLPPVIPKRLNTTQCVNKQPVLQISHSYVNTIYPNGFLREYDPDYFSKNENNKLDDRRQIKSIKRENSCKCGGDDGRNNRTIISKLQSSQGDNYILMSPKIRTTSSDVKTTSSTKFSWKTNVTDCNSTVDLISSRCHVCTLRQHRRRKRKKWNSLNTLTEKPEMDHLENRRQWSKSVGNILYGGSSYVTDDDFDRTSILRSSTTTNVNDHRQNPNYRDSSSSNDSGFSFGSLKIIKNKTCCRGESTRANRSLFSQRSRSSEPFVPRAATEYNLSCSHKSCSAEANVPLYPKHTHKENAVNTKESDKSSIPYMDSQSTASETSDMSDYIETLSLSSYSSSETPQTSNNTRFLYQNTAKLKPRSRNQYEKVHTVFKF